MKGGAEAQGYQTSFVFDNFRKGHIKSSWFNLRMQLDSELYSYFLGAPTILNNEHTFNRLYFPLKVFEAGHLWCFVGLLSQTKGGNEDKKRLF